MITKYALLGLLLLAVVGCAATARRGEPIAGPFTPSSPAEARGERVFMQFCSQCHPGGEGGLGPSINDKPLPGFMIKLQVRAGMGTMPGFPPNVLSDAELDDLVAYLKAIRVVDPKADRVVEPEER